MAALASRGRVGNSGGFPLFVAWASVLEAVHERLRVTNGVRGGNGVAVGFFQTGVRSSWYCYLHMIDSYAEYGTLFGAHGGGRPRAVGRTWRNHGVGGVFCRGRGDPRPISRGRGGRTLNDHAEMES